AATSQSAQAPRKPAVYSQAEIDQLAAYVASLGAGPAVPTEEEYGPQGADIAKGGELFPTNCAQCHNFTGKGGALTHGKYAPDLEDVDPKHVYQAMLTGPQNMPSVPGSVLTAQSKTDTTPHLQAGNSGSSESRAGLALGSLGTVAEGLFGWVFGPGGLLAVAVWVGA